MTEILGREDHGVEIRCRSFVAMVTTAEVQEGVADLKRDLQVTLQQAASKTKRWKGG